MSVTKGASWTAIVGITLGVIAFAWQVAGAWFDLQHRVNDLEKAQRFSHGDVKPFLSEE